MTDERKLIPVDSSYVNALGLATYAFARCEWQVAWCSEKVQPGSLDKIVSKEMTAGNIAKHVANIVRNMPKSKEREELGSPATDFSSLVVERNRIIHGKPCTAPNGKQRLSSKGIIEIADLERAADAFMACGSKLSSLFYRFLEGYAPK